MSDGTVRIEPSEDGRTASLTMPVDEWVSLERESSLAVSALDIAARALRGAGLDGDASDAEDAANVLATSVRMLARSVVVRCDMVRLAR